MGISVKSKCYNGFPLPINLYSQEIQGELTQSIRDLVFNSKLPQEASNDALVCELDYSNGLTKIQRGKNKFY